MTAVPLAGRPSWLLAVLFALTPGTEAAQAPIVAPVSSFAPSDEVELGREAASVIRARLPILTDGRVDVYVNALGRRLVEAIPERFRQPGFEYAVAVLNDTNLSSVALPGGPVFISRGMVDLAHTEGALAGLIAHELSHIVLRHATAQVTSGERYQLGAITGRAIGTVLSTRSIGIMNRGADFAVSTYFLMYERGHERQADTLATEITARAGYDPRALGVMIHTIETEGAPRGGRLWARRHPAPGGGEEGISRLEAICREAAGLGIEAAKPLWDPLPEIQMRLAEVAAPLRVQGADRGGAVPSGTRRYEVVVPAGESQIVTAGDLLQLSVPANWHRRPVGNTAIFAPDDAFLVPEDGPGVVTHGMQVGVARSLTGGLEGDMQALLESFSRDSPSVRWTPAYRRVSFGRRSGLTTALSNVSPVTGEFEYVSVSAVYLPDGSFLYVIGVAPQLEAGIYGNAFNRILDSMQILN